MADDPTGSGQSDRPSSQPFALAGAGQAFGSRSQGVFGDLETIEAKHEAYERVRRRSRHDDHQNLWKSDPVGGEELGQSSGRGNRRPPKRDSDGFLRPDSRPAHHHRRAQRVADHRQHPERWTKYDLSDVSSDDLSERSNTSAAFAFLSSRRKENAPSSSTSISDEMDVDHWTVKPGPSSDITCRPPSDHHKDLNTFKMKHTFRKPRNASDKSTESEAVESKDKSKFVRGKYVMPEYEIGTARRLKTSNKPARSELQEGNSLAALGSLNDIVDDTVATESEQQSETVRETTMETTTVEKGVPLTGFKSRRKFNKEAMRQKRLTESDEED